MVRIIEPKCQSPRNNERTRLTRILHTSTALSCRPPRASCVRSAISIATFYAVSSAPLGAACRPTTPQPKSPARFADRASVLGCSPSAQRGFGQHALNKYHREPVSQIRNPRHTKTPNAPVSKTSQDGVVLVISALLLWICFGFRVSDLYPPSMVILLRYVHTV